MTMGVRITNEDTKTDQPPTCKLKVSVLDHGQVSQQQALLGPGESFLAYVHSTRDLILEETSVPPT